MIKFTDMKKWLTIAACLFVLHAAAQDEGEYEPGFKKQNMMVGGSLTISFGNNNTVLGASPYVGYSLTSWLDAGFIVNYVYSGVRNVTYVDPNNGQYFFSNDKLRQHTYGPGAFIRLFPIPQLFVQVQGEHNFISQKIKYDNGAPAQKSTTSATSVLVGAGYASGRTGPRTPMYYISLLFDVAQDRNSPYVEITQYNNVNVLPILRAGVQFPLFPGRNR